MTKVVALLRSDHRRQGQQAKEYVETLGPKCLPKDDGNRNLKKVKAAMNLSRVPGAIAHQRPPETKKPVEDQRVVWRKRRDSNPR